MRNLKPRKRKGRAAQSMPRYNPKGTAPTKAEKALMAAVKCMGCIKCQKTPVDIHHITEGGRRLGHAWILPLCAYCHRWINNFLEQMALCRELYLSLGEVMPEPVTKIVPRR